MENSKKKNPTTRFLIGSFIGLLIFSIIMFSLLGIYMGRKSKNAVYEIGKIYMSGMNEQMSRHFETVIKLRFNQVSGIVSVVPTDTDDKDTLYEELIYRAQVREFDYLALCSAEGDFQTLYGQSIQPLNPKPFVEALRPVSYTHLKQLCCFCKLPPFDIIMNCKACGIGENPVQMIFGVMDLFCHFP